MSPRFVTRLGAAAAIAGPAILLAAFIYHPYIFNAADADDIAAVVVPDTTRWGVAHLGIAVGYALTAVAFLAVRRYLRDVGEQRWSSIALPLVILGSALFTVLPGMEFAPLAAAETGGDVAGAQEALQPWFLPVIITAALSFGLGALGFAAALIRSRVLVPRLRWLVVAALIVLAVVRFVPLGPAQIVLGVAAVTALWPLAYEMWSKPIPSYIETSESMKAQELRKAA